MGVGWGGVDGNKEEFALFSFVPYIHVVTLVIYILESTGLYALANGFTA